MRALQIISVPEGSISYPGIAALGEDGRVYVRKAHDISGPWTQLPSLSNFEQEQS